MTKQFNDTYPFGDANGYTMAEARKIAASVRKAISGVRGIKEIIVDILPMENGNYKVVNSSIYESDSDFD